VGADSRELAALVYGIMDRSNRSVSSFRLPIIRLNQADSHVMVEVIEKRLVERIWDEISVTEARAEEFLSREFIARDADGKSRSVGGFAQLSDHYTASVPRTKRSRTSQQACYRATACLLWT
jgi:hypothetical protein